MSGSKTRHAVSAATTSSAHSAGSVEEEGGASQSHRVGRKETEHKRRALENQYYDELTTLLALISDRHVAKKMDKVATLREAAICIKVYYDLTQKTPQDSAPKAAKSPTASQSGLSSPWSAATGGSFLSEGDLLEFFLDAHDSFLMLVSESGHILYTTELVTSLLGQMPSRLVGQNVYDHVHSSHRSVIRGLFNPPKDIKGTKLPNSSLLAYPPQYFTAQFQLYTGETILTPQYLPFVCMSFLRLWAESPADRDGAKRSSESGNSPACVIIIAKLSTLMAPMDLAVGTNDVNFEFEMRISREGHIIDVDRHAVMVFGFSTSELIGTLFFEYVDPYHIADVGASMATFLNNGIGTTTPYRVRTKGNRSMWLISKGYLSYNPWNNKLNHILLANRVLGCDQVLVEQKFYQSKQHLPDTEGKEVYVPHLPPSTSTRSLHEFSHPTVSSQRVTAQSLPQVIRSCPQVLRTHPQAAAEHRNSLQCPTLNDSSKVNESSHFSLRPSTPCMDEGAMLNPLYQARMDVGGGGLPPHITKLPESVCKLQQRDMLLRQYEKSVMEREQELHRQQMQFFRCAEKMMHQLSQANSRVGGGNMAAVGLNTNSMLEYMSKAIDGMSSPATPTPAASPHSMMGSEEQGYPTLQLPDPMSQRHQIPCTNSPGHASSLANNVSHAPASQNSLYANSSERSPIFRTSQPTPTSDEGKYHQPKSCMLYNSHQSLDEHNVQFYQQQQQQQERQQQQQQSMYTLSTLRGRLLSSDSIAASPGSMASPMMNSNPMASTETTCLMEGTARANGEFDLADILSASQTFPPL